MFAMNEMKSQSSVLVAVVLGTIAPALFLLAPIVVGGLVEERGMTVQTAGYVIAAELTGMALGIIPAAGWLDRLDWRVTARLSLAMLCVGNILTGVTPSISLIIVERLLTGFAAGTVSAICADSLAHRTNPGRWYGILVTAQFLFAGLGMWALPHLSRYGLRGAFFFLAASAFLLLFLTPYLQRGPDAPAGHAMVSCASRSATAFVVPGVFLYFAGVNGVWIYVDRLGVQLGLSFVAVGNILAFSAIFAVLGAICAAVAGERVSVAVNCALGLFATICSLVLSLYVHGEQDYKLFICVFAFAWSYSWPYLLAVPAKIDPGGRLALDANAAIWAGLAAGPIAAAGLYTIHPGVHATIVAAIVCVSAALILISAPEFTRFIRPSALRVDNRA
jgi:predicted MFS family arabinose efflux permease